MLRRALAVLLLATAFLPVASADVVCVDALQPVVGARPCAGETGGGAQACTSPSAYDADGAWLGAVSVYGYERCPAGQTEHGVRVDPVLAWTTGPSGCRTVVAGADLGCPAGPPPNPGWGDLLP